MCLIVFAWDDHPKYKLILAANRDEFYKRPTAPATFWENHPNILGGRDLQAGGSWMTLSKSGKLAAVTNYRDLKNIRETARSRGDIPTGYMKTKDSARDYLNKLHQSAGEYNGFNVILSDLKNMFHYSNYERKINVISKGIHGISNALLDTSWPKVELAKKKFTELIESKFTHQGLIEMLGDTSVAEDAVLPDTGLSQEMERALSAMCIRTEEYGTRCTTVITIDRDNEVSFTEKTYPLGDSKENLVNYTFKIK